MPIAHVLADQLLLNMVHVQNVREDINAHQALELAQRFQRECTTAAEICTRSKRKRPVPVRKSKLTVRDDLMGGGTIRR